MEAAEVLPCSCRVTMIFSGGRPSFLAVPCMMRKLAWWGMSQSTSAAVLPAFSSTARAVLSSRLTASLKTACPSMCSRGVPSAWPPLTWPGTQRMSTCLPSACKSVARMPGVSLASSTTAPAPSPKSTQVVRSLKSRMRLNTSAPMTRARRAPPARIMASATVRA